MGLINWIIVIRLGANDDFASLRESSFKRIFNMSLKHIGSHHSYLNGSSSYKIQQSINLESLSGVNGMPPKAHISGETFSFSQRP